MAPKVIFLMADYGHDPTGISNCDFCGTRTLADGRQKQLFRGRCLRTQDLRSSLPRKLDNRRGVTIECSPGGPGLC